MIGKHLAGSQIAVLMIVMWLCVELSNRCRAQIAPDQESPAVSGGKPVSEAFRTRDSDGDASLSSEELIAGGGQDTAALKRDFKAFDANSDGRLNATEFLTIPSFTPEDQRSPIPDPVVMLSETSLSVLKAHWDEWELDGDRFLSVDEFSAEAIGKLVPGLGKTSFESWDADQDGKVSHAEAALLLDIAFGACVATGERLRSASGHVADWGFFRTLDPDGDGRVTRPEYMVAMNQVADAVAWYHGIVRDGNDSFGMAEFATSNHRTNPVQLFLDMDVDQDARLSPDELGPIPWGPQDRKWLLGSDDDFDGGYSLREFMLIPHINLLAPWHTAQDSNQDGKLSREEFRFLPSPALVGLCAEYFQRLDLNDDQSLSLVEWPFQTSHPDARFVLLDFDADGELTEREFTAEGSLPPKPAAAGFQDF